MDKLLVVGDGKKYTAYSGSSYAQIATLRKLSNTKLGYSKAMEVQFPVTKRKQLYIGPSVTLTLNFILLKSGEIPLKLEQYIALDELINNGELFLGDYVTNLANLFATKALIKQKDLLYSQLLINSIVPKIEFFIRQDLTYLQDLLPFLGTAVKLNSEVIPNIEARVGKIEDAQLQAWLNLTALDLQTAYHPDDEVEARINHHKKVLEFMPTTDAPTQAEINNAEKIIVNIRNEINKPTLLSGKGSGKKRLLGK